MTVRKVLSVGWLLVALLLLFELLGHAAASTSDPKSQGLRALFIGFYLVAAGGLWFGFRYSKAATIIVSVIVGLRGYVILAIPIEIEWTSTNLEALAVVVLALLTIIAVFVVQWRRSLA
jgi:hypothetical protein